MKWATSEESKVKLWHRVSLVSDLKKGGANRIAYFLHSIFKEQAPLSPANARCFAGSGVSSARVGPWQPEPAPPSLLCLSQLVCCTSSMRDKSKVPQGNMTCALTPIAVSCCRIPA